MTKIKFDSHILKDQVLPDVEQAITVLGQASTAATGVSFPNSVGFEGIGPEIESIKGEAREVTEWILTNVNQYEKTVEEEKERINELEVTNIQEKSLYVQHL